MCELGIDKIRFRRRKAGLGHGPRNRDPRIKFIFFRRRKAGLDMGICWKRNNEIQRATTTSVSKPEVTALQIVQDEIS